MKTWYRGGDKGEGGLSKKDGVVFLRGVDTPMHTMILPVVITLL